MGTSTLILAVSLALVVLLQLTTADLPIAAPKRRMANTYSEPIACKDRRGCLSCTEAMICNYSDQMVGSFDCGSVDPLRPYCGDAGECVPDMRAKCKLPSDLCPSTNIYFPVPSNCSEAVFCDSGKNAIKISSPSLSYMFSFKKQSWTLRPANEDCFQINCQSPVDEGRWVAYAPEPRLSVFCGTTGPITFQCNAENEMFDESKRTCVFRCLTEGDFPHPTIRTSYYSCLLSPSGSLEKFERTCPTNLVFEGTKCVVES